MKKQIIKEVKRTPFKLVQEEDNNYIAVLGRYALTKTKFKDEEDFRVWLNTDHWTVTAIVASIIADQLLNKPNNKEE